MVNLGTVVCVFTDVKSEFLNFRFLGTSTQKQPSCEKNGVTFTSLRLGGTSCEIKSGSQEMAAMISMLITCGGTDPTKTPVIHPPCRYENLP